MCCNTMFPTTHKNLVMFLYIIDRLKHVDVGVGIMKFWEITPLNISINVKDQSLKHVIFFW